MIVSLRKWIERIKFIALFLLFSYLVNVIFGYLSAWIEPNDPYRQPKGDAVKAFEQLEQTSRSSIAERLKLFYWYGE